MAINFTKIEFDLTGSGETAAPAPGPTTFESNINFTKIVREYAMPAGGSEESASAGTQTETVVSNSDFYLI
jgi:hypothetical protein